MKPFSVLAAACSLALLATVLPAQADPRVALGDVRLFVTGRAGCGCPEYSCRVCTGHDRNRRPVYETHRHPFVCGCGHGGDHRGAVRKFHERRANEYHNHQERLHKVREDYERDLAKVYDKHHREMRDISRERNPRKYHERRANEERNHRERLHKVEEDYRRDLAKVHDKHRRELEDQYRDLQRQLR